MLKNQISQGWIDLKCFFNALSEWHFSLLEAQVLMNQSHARQLQEAGLFYYLWEIFFFFYICLDVGPCLSWHDSTAGCEKFLLSVTKRHRCLRNASWSWVTCDGVDWKYEKGCVYVFETFLELSFSSLTMQMFLFVCLHARLLRKAPGTYPPPIVHSAILPQAIVINQQRLHECNLSGGGRQKKNFLKRKSKQTKEVKKDNNRDD